MDESSIQQGLNKWIHIPYRLLHFIFLDVFFVFGGWFLQEKVFFFKLTLINFFLLSRASDWKYRFLS